MEHDFGDGNGPVPAHRHPRGGGWVADTAFVGHGVWVGPEATVYGDAWVTGSAVIAGRAQVCGDAAVAHDACVRDQARVCGRAWVHDRAIVQECAKVRGDAWLRHDVRVSGDADVRGSARLTGTAEAFLFFNVDHLRKAIPPPRPMLVLLFRDRLLFTGNDNTAPTPSALVLSMPADMGRTFCLREHGNIFLWGPQ